MSERETERDSANLSSSTVSMGMQSQCAGDALDPRHGKFLIKLSLSLSLALALALALSHTLTLSLSLSLSLSHTHTHTLSLSLSFFFFFSFFIMMYPNINTQLKQTWF